MSVATISTASAQATRTWVSGVGDDANPCSRTAPCKTFAGAISKTAAGGIIDALDPAGYGAVTITKSIIIRAVGVEGGITNPGTSGVNVNSATANVTLIGLNIDGVGTGTSGVNVVNASQVTIKDCTISGSANGVRVSSAALARVTITDSLIHNNTTGILVEPTGAQNNRVFLDNVIVDANITNASINQVTGLLWMRRSTMLAPITLTNGATLRSFGDNALGGATPTLVTPLQ